MSAEQSEHVPTFMPTANRPVNIGRTLDDQTSRLDAVEKVTGRAKYGRDRYLPNGLFVALIRCPWGAADRGDYDEQAARAVPGVLFVNVSGERGRYHGHPVGWLAAESKQALRRGLRALDLKWERQPVDTEITDVVEDEPLDVSEETAALLAEADHVLEAVYSTPVQTHSCLETHGTAFDYTGKTATMYVSTQGTFAARDGLAETLSIPKSQFEVICEYVGGGFGSKLNGAGKEGTTAGAAAERFKRPVYLFLDRAEEHLDTGNRPSSRSAVKIGFKADGTIVGGRIHTWGGVGIGRGGGGVRFPSDRYDVGTIQRTHKDVNFAGGAPRPFRAPGCPQGAFAEELMLDEIATRAGVDPLDLRMRLDADEDRRAMYETGAGLVGWSERVATGEQTGVVRRGLGMGSTSWPRFPAVAEAEVVIHADGSVEARTGTQDIGTGQRTVMGVVAADRLGVPLRAVEVRIGSSNLPTGPASGGSVTSHNTAPAMAAAAEDARQKLLERLADLNTADASEFDIVDGQVLRHDRPFLTWAEACRRLGPDGITGRGRWDQGTRGRDESTGHSHGAQFVDLQVDTETGVIRVNRVVAIQACGQVVCRKTAESQIIGGVVQGLSFALFERKLLDRNVGSMVNPNLEWYKILGTDDMPRIEPILWERGQTGVRSLGEPPTIPTAGATACALYNALGHPVRDLPLTPDRVLAALEEGASA